MEGFWQWNCIGRLQCQKIFDRRERVMLFFKKRLNVHIHHISESINFITSLLKDDNTITNYRPGQFIKKNPPRCNSVSKFYYSIFIWSSTCLGRHTAHHQEPKTALEASGFSYVEGCWTCSWWTLSGTLCLTMSNNLPRMKNQRLLVQF
jgi:hypothetical protein